MSDWQEVPQARFLSWSREMQLAYCAARDADASMSTDSPWWATFYSDRAAGYMADMKAPADGAPADGAPADDTETF